MLTEYKVHNIAIPGIQSMFPLHVMNEWKTKIDVVLIYFRPIRIFHQHSSLANFSISIWMTLSHSLIFIMVNQTTKNWSIDQNIGFAVQLLAHLLPRSPFTQYNNANCKTFPITCITLYCNDALSERTGEKKCKQH